MCLLATCMSSLEKYLFRSSTHFFFFFFFLYCYFILSCMSCLYILEINPFSIASFANIFYHSEGFLFLLFIVSVAVKKLLSFIRCHLFIFVFICITLEGRSKKTLLWFMSKKVLCFSLRVFLVSSLTFKSLIHFKFIFSVWCSVSSVQSLSRVQLFATPRIAARQASLSVTNSQSSPKLMCIESVMPSSHLIYCCPLLLLPPIPPSIRV